MDLTRQLLGLEQAGWQALIDGRGVSHYRQAMAPDVVVIGVSGAGVVAGDVAAEHLGGQRWGWFRLRGPRARALGELAAALTYRVIARRDFDVEYQALVTSTYRRDGEGWRLVHHQHTPV